MRSEAVANVKRSDERLGNDLFCFNFVGDMTLHDGRSDSEFTATPDRETDEPCR